MTQKTTQPENIPPYYGNPNGKKCTQCCYKMAMEHFFPNQKLTFDELDTMCNVTGEEGAWPYKPIVELSKMGLDLHVYTTYDNVEFLSRPREYLTEKLGEEVARYCVESANFEGTLPYIAQYNEAVEKGAFKETKANHNPEVIKNFIDEGYVICVWVESKRLNNKEGFEGHFVLVYDYNDEGVIMHDPGGTDPKTHIPSRFEKWDHFMASCCPSNDVEPGITDDLIAIRKKNA